MGKTVNIGLGEHIAGVGATGSGKTVMINELVSRFIIATEGYLPVYILDTKCPISRPEMSDFKHLFRGDIGQRHTGNKVPKPISPKGKNFVQVWTPEEDLLDNYDEFFKGIYQAGAPAVVLVDELSSVSTNRGDITRYHNILLKQGRGLSISSLNLTQSPSFIGQSIMRQAFHVFRFRLNNPYDSKKLEGIFGKKVNEEPTDSHGFWYRNVSIPTHKSPAAYYENMQEFFGIE